MAITVTTNQTLISNCDSETGWSNDTRFELDPSVQIQGNGCLGDWINATTSTVIQYAIGSATDMSGQHLYAWMQCTGVVDTRANGGYRLYASDGTNWATWYVGGNDTHANGWQLLFCSLEATPDESSGTLNTSAITIVGVQFKTLTIGFKKGQTYIMNCFWDVLRYGDALTVTSGATDNITMEDIFAVDTASTNKYGIVLKNTGAYIMGGGLELGDTGTNSVDMVMSGEVLLYPDNDLASTTLNSITLLGNATGESNLDIAGSFIKSNNVPGVFDTSGSNLDTVNIDGNSLVNMGACTFNASQTITSNVFDTSTSVSPNGATFELNTINTSGLITVATTGTFTKNIINDASGAVAMVVSDTAHAPSNTLDSDGSNHAMELTTVGDGTMDWSCNTTDYDAGETGTPVTPTSTGNEDIYVSASSGEVDINVQSGATTPSIRSAGATVNVIAGLLPITITVKDAETGLGIPDANVMVKREDTKATIISGTTNGSGIYSESIAASYDGVDYVAWARQMDLIGIDYVQQDQSGTIGSVGADINFSLEQE